MKKILKVIYYTTSGAIIIVALLLIVSLFPITGNIETKSVLSGSMEPTIHTGSLIVLRPISNYKIEDIITFGNDTKTEVPTTHRIIEKGVENGEIVYKTKGDANNAEDSKEVLQKDVLGKVYFSIPYLGYIINFVKKPIGLMVIIIIPSIIIIYEELKKVCREIKNLCKKKKQNKLMIETGVLDLREKVQKQTEQKKGSKGSILIAIAMLLNFGFIYSSYASSYFSDIAILSGSTFAVGALPGASVVFNEFLPRPQNNSHEPLGEWVEFYNLSTEPIDLAGYYITDSSNDHSDAHKIYIEACRTNTSNTFLPPSGFLVVYAKGDGKQCGSNGFQLNNTGDTLNLFSSEGMRVDSYTYNLQDICKDGDNCNNMDKNISFAKISDGSGLWSAGSPTPGMPNELYIKLVGSSGPAQIEISNTSTEPSTEPQIENKTGIVPEKTPDEYSTQPKQEAVEQPKQEENKLINEEEIKENNITEPKEPPVIEGSNLVQPTEPEQTSEPQVTPEEIISSDPAPVVE